MKTVATADQAVQRRGLNKALAWALTVAAAVTAQGALGRTALGAGAPIQVTGVAAGAASIQRSGLKTTITAADRTIIDYSRFNIPVGSQVQFIQPSASAKVLNRINSVTPTRIDGQLSANGIVYFTNPSGIIFGPNSVVNVGQMFAAAGTISNEDFLSNINHFTQVTGGVANFGRIEANAVTLIGRQAANYGSIIAPGGVVTLASGSDVFIGEQGSNVMVKITDAPAKATVNPQPTEPAVSGGPSVGMGSGDMFAMASMRALNAGKIKASRVTMQAPKGLVAAGGTIDASNANGAGGTVTLTGQTVVVNKARIDASGSTGGGTIQVGGDFAGGGTVPTAQWTFVSPGSTLRADATTAGDGGKVSVWADGTTVFGGTIYARALGATGNGGQAEVSGKEHLRVTGHAVLTSVGGTSGTLLLDPGSVAITHSAVEVGGGASNDTFTDAYINTQLGMGSLIISTANSTNGGAEDLTVAADAVISWNTGNNLTLIGNNSLTMAGTITATTIGSLILTGGAVAVPGTVNLAMGNYYAGGTTYTAPGTVEATLGTVTLNFSGAVALGATTATELSAVSTAAGISQLAGSALTIGGVADFSAVAGNVTVAEAGNHFGTISAAGNNLTLADTGAMTLGNLLAGGTLTVTAGGPVSQAAGTSVGAAGVATVTATGMNVSLGNAGNNFSTLTVTGQDVLINDDGAVVLGNLDVGGILTVTAGGNVSQAPGTTILAAGETQVVTTGAATLGSTNNNFSTISVSGTNVTIGDADEVVLGNIAASGTLTVTAAGDVTQTGPGAVTVAGRSIFTTPGRDVLLGNATNNFSTVTATAFNVTLRDSTALVAGDMDLAGTLTVLAGGNVTQAPGTTMLVIGETTITSPGVVTVGSTNNNFSTINIGATNVTIGDADELVLGNITASGTLTVTAAGDVTQTAGGAVVATGLSTFTVPGRAVLLGNAGNNFSTVTVTALDVTLRDSNALVAGNMDLAGTLTVTAGGNVSQAPGTTMLVIGETAITSPGVVTVGSVNNNFSTISVSGTNVTIGDADEVVLKTVAAAGTLTVTAAGDVTQTGAGSVTATGLTTITAPGRDISLANAANNFSTVTATALDVTLRDADALVLGNVDLAGTLTVTAGGNISQAPGMTVLVAGLTTLAANGSVAVGSVNNNFSTITASGTSVTIGDADAVVLGTVVSGGALTVTAAGDVSQTGSGSVTATGLTTITAPGRDISLANAANNFATVAVNGMDVTLRDAGAMTFAASTITGNLTVTTAGALGQSGAVTVTGTTSLAAGAGGAILLSTATNDFGGAVTVASGGNVTLVDTNALTLGNVAATGTLTATSGAGADLTLAGTQSGLARAILTAGGAIVQTSGSVSAGTINLAAGNGISGVSAGVSGNDAFAVATQNISGTSGDSALVSIVNTSVASTTLTGLTTVGGQIKFRQAGGGALNATGTVSAAGAANGAGAGGAGGDVTFLAANALDVAAITTSGGSGTTTGGDAGDITLNAGGPITLWGNLAAAGGAGPTPGAAGDVTLNQNALVALNVVITGHDVTFPGTVDSTGGAWALTINTSGSGTTRFGSHVGQNSTLGALTTNADGTTRLGGSVRAMGATFADPLVLTANSVMTITGGASFTTINSDGTARSLGITQTGAGAITGAIGGISPLISFNLAGGSMAFNGGTATTTLGQSWNTGLTLGADTTLTGTTLVFAGSIDSGGGAARALTLLNSGAAAFNPVTVGGTAPLASLNVTGASNVILRGSIATIGDITFAGPVGGPAGSGGPSDIVLAASSPTARIVFNGLVGSSAAVPSFRTFTTDTPGVVLFLGAANGVYATNLIEFKATGRAGVPLAASAGKPDGNLTLAVRSGGTIRFAQNDKFTVFGDMALLAPGGTIRLGDLSARGNITVTADSILLQNRDAAPNLNTAGLTPDAGYDIVAGGSLAFSVAPMPNPLSPHVSFATTTGLPADDVNHTLGAFGLRMAGPIADSEFFSGGTLLDLVARGPTITPITQSLAGALPWDAYGVRPERNVVISGIVRDTLHEMGVYARNLTDDELAQALVGFILADDSHKKTGKPLPRDFTIASNRLPLEQVLPAIASYEELFFAAKLDKNGKPILDSYGKPVRDHSKPEEENLKKLFEEAWKTYAAKEGNKATPEGFRRFLSSSGNLKALVALDKLRDLILQVQGLGLTPMEVSVSRTILVSRIKPASLNVSQFSTAILGSALSPTAALPGGKPAI